MAITSVVTVRIDQELLAALKATVQREGITVSRAIVDLIRAKVGPTRTKHRRRTMGMFAGQFEDLELADYKEARREASARLLSSVRRQRR